MLEMVEEGRRSILPLEDHLQVRKGGPIPSWTRPHFHLSRRSGWHAFVSFMLCVSTPGRALLPSWKGASHGPFLIVFFFSI